MSGGKLLEAIASEILACRQCELWRTRRNAVPGEGSPDSRIMFVGEAPGYREDIEGKPFVGSAGEFLETLLPTANLSRENVFIGNILKCRPPRNREPRSVEIETCTPYLDKQIQIIKPEVIATLGRYATGYIFSKNGLRFDGIAKARGKPFEAVILKMPVLIFPTFHPAAALYSGEYRRLLRRDFKQLKRLIDKRLNG
ncbi:uracil-DNA glycosylase [Candidatus Bathyarchaeota archaeon]|nr:uracil-DNA glycosylase [Candidatus Bathyarchaeota archaeon]